MFWHECFTNVCPGTDLPLQTACPRSRIGCCVGAYRAEEKKKGGGECSDVLALISLPQKKKKKRTGKGDEITFTFYWKAKISGQPND